MYVHYRQIFHGAFSVRRFKDTALWLLVSASFLLAVASGIILQRSLFWDSPYHAKCSLLVMSWGTACISLIVEEQEAILILKLHVAFSATHMLNWVCSVLVAQNKECVR